MRATERIVPVVLAATGATVAVARLRALESLSPPDLAFFHQATWNAARGNGFVQTALEFDAGSLLGSIHLSLIRAVWVPFYAVLPAPETLVGLQGAALMGGTAAIGSRVIPRAGRPAIWMAVLALHPLTMALTTCDLRPLTFIVPAGMLVVAGLYSGRTLVVMAGVVGTALAREEAWLVLLAMVPFALMQARKAGHRRSLVALLGGVIGAWALPRGIWGHGGNITANADPMGTLQALFTGARPWFRWPVESTFAARCLVVAWPAIRCPELLVPAVVGWFLLTVFSNMEPAAPEHGGLHYLSVLAPLLLGAATVGWARFEHGGSESDRSGWRRWALLGLLGLFLAGPELQRSAMWCVQAIQGSALSREVDRIRQLPGGVLTTSQAAPLLSGRPVLRIQGHFAPTPERVTTVSQEIDHALLSAERPPDGPPAEEWDAWQNALPAAGLHVRTTAEGVEVWER